MLVLTRKIGQRLMIADNIRITVLDCSGGRVRIGIEAPHHIPIIREELRGRADTPVTAQPLRGQQ